MTEKSDDDSRAELPAEPEARPSEPSVPTAATAPIPPTPEVAPTVNALPATPVHAPAAAPASRRRPGWVVPVIAAASALLLLGGGFSAGWAAASATSLVSFDRGVPGPGDRFGGPDGGDRGGPFDRHGDDDDSHSPNGGQSGTDDGDGDS